MIKVRQGGGVCLRLNRFSRAHKKDLTKLLNFAKRQGVKVLMRDVAQLGGAGGSYCSEDKKIEIPNHLDGNETILTLAHELGHYLSEKNEEVSKKQHEAYDSYPEKRGIKTSRKNATIIKYIETRAVYHSELLIKKLKISIDQQDIDIDCLYNILSLNHILKHGTIEDNEIDKLFNRVYKLNLQGKNWKEYCSKHLN